DLRSVYCVYLTQDLNISQYIDYCNERDITHIKFMERTELLTWLQGVSTESSYIVSPTSATETASGAETVQDKQNEASASVSQADPRLNLIYENEIALVDHNTVLRGYKPVDFSNLTKVCQDSIMLHFKNKQQQSKSKSRVEKISVSSSRNRDPIILISPSASSLLNMFNAKEFLENGRFDPNTGSGTPASNIQMISHHTKRMGTLRFVVTDSIERFTKDEHWDRVVAVFTTGQAWQFKPYKWSDPYELFQKTKGFCLIYDNENIPGEVKNWNVETLNINRNRRFKDQEVHEHLWGEIERWMEKRGWGNK
ncbi:RNA polymerase II accessory factor, partial [Nadsonia fulvescens var. elongata DSM 6958]